MAISDYLANLINGSADAYGVPRNIAFAVAQQESNYNSDPTFSSGANSNGSHDWGPFQLNDKYIPNAPNMSLADQVNTAIAKLSNLFKSTGNWQDALRAYNGGLTGTKKDPNLSLSYAQSVLDKAGGVTDVATAIQTGQQISPNAIQQGAADMVGADVNATGNSVNSPNGANNPGAPPTVGQSIANDVSKAVQDAIVGLTNNTKTYFVGNGLKWVVIAGGGLLVLFAILHTLEGGANGDAAKAVVKLAPLAA